MEEDAACPVKSGDLLAEKYKVQQVLGVGGMGVVVAAEHVDLREKVALKFLLDEATENVEMCERFLREARAAVKIKSEHVVRVSDVGRMPTGAPYMVMEYLDGEDLSATLERGALPIEDAVDYLIQSCEAMNVAHREGIVHRDLKPANLFLTRRPDGSPIVKVLDFGISKVTDDAQSLSLTHTQALMGSPLYMSPEQMKSTKAVDKRTDIWALGVILYEMLAGDVPFSGESFPQVLVKVMGEQPDPLQQRRPEVPEALAQVVESCLSKDPANRPQSVAELAVLLAPFASKRTVGLQNRFAQAMSRPPQLPAAAGLARTQIEQAGDGVQATQSGGAVQGTSTAWAELTQEKLTVPKRGSSRALVIGGGGLVAAALGVLAMRFVGGEPPTVSSPVPASAQAAAPAPAVPPPAVVPPPVREEVKVAKEAVPEVAREETKPEPEAQKPATKAPVARKVSKPATTARKKAKAASKARARKAAVRRRMVRKSTASAKAAAPAKATKPSATEKSSTTSVRKRRSLSLDFK